MTTTPEISMSESLSPDAQAILEQPGQFELPVPARNNENVAGAAVAGWDDRDEALADSHEDFPMIVWLRGDEPWFSSFDMDADAVMRTLGIKRSRLTQIAGKDLRVGRVRVDRYIRPVFRSADVERYVSWTRATASHQKSSEAIKIAVDGLQKQSSLIHETLDHISSRFTAEIRQEMEAFIARAVDAGIRPSRERVESLDENIRAIAKTMESSVTEAGTSFADAARALSATVESLQKNQQAALELMTLKINQTSEKVAMMEERLTAWDSLLAENINVIRDHLEQLRKPRVFSKTPARKVKGLSSHSANPNTAKPPLSLRAAPKKR